MIEITLFVVGVALICYPTWDDYVQKKKQNDILMQLNIAREEQTIPIHQTTLKDNSIDDKNDFVEVEVDRSEEQAETASNEPIMMGGEQVIGALAIEKIDVHMPLLARTTAQALNLGVTSVVPEIMPGDDGNFAIAGHRGRSFGRLLNRLDEMEEGDQIVVETTDQDYVYEVVSTFLVEPEGVHVLDQDYSIQELTLITCHPVRNPTHRIIVKAQLIHTSETDVTREV